MTSVIHDWHTARVLWQRDVMRMLRQPSRIVGALGQPVVFWFIIGAGLSSTFVLPGLKDIQYIEFFFPGVVAMILVFASIFSAISVIDDRNQGFLQSVLAGPGSRASMVLGKCLGATCVALIQAALFLGFAPLAGFDIVHVAWTPMLLGTILLSFGLSAFGFGVAWWLNNVQSYHAIQLLLLMPLWIISGAMFPPTIEQPWFTAAMYINPIAYGVSIIRAAAYGASPPPGLVLEMGLVQQIGLLALFAAVSFWFAVSMARRGK